MALMPCPHCNGSGKVEDPQAPRNAVIRPEHDWGAKRSRIVRCVNCGLKADTYVNGTPLGPCITYLPSLPHDWVPMGSRPVCQFCGSSLFEEDRHGICPKRIA